MNECEYCNRGTILDANKPIIKDKDEELEVYIDSINLLNIETELMLCYEVINFCPICGRKLVE